MNYFKKGQVKEGQRFIDDRYGKRLHVGAPVAFHRKGEVLSGRVTSVHVYTVEESSKDLDKVTLKIFVKEDLSEKIYELRNSLSLIYMNNG
jgi:hypothetical protein